MEHWKNEQPKPMYNKQNLTKLKEMDGLAPDARKAGATDAEMIEAAMIAAAMRAGTAVTHATHALPS